MLKATFVLLLITVLYVNCDGGMLDGQKDLNSRRGRNTTGASTGYGGGIGTGGGKVTPPPDAPHVENPGEDSEQDIGCTYSPPFDLSDELQTVMADITNCDGQPLANLWLLEAVRKLQAIDPRFGFMLKTGPDRIPRDIVAFNWMGDGEGSGWFYVFDVVASGCNNWPSAPEYEDPQPNARVAWQFCNPDGWAGNGTWSYNPF